LGGRNDWIQGGDEANTVWGLGLGGVSKVRKKESLTRRAVTGGTYKKKKIGGKPGDFLKPKGSTRRERNSKG